MHKIDTKVSWNRIDETSSNSKQRAGKPHKQRTFRLLIWGVIPF